MHAMAQRIKAHRRLSAGQGCGYSLVFGIVKQKVNRLGDSDSERGIPHIKRLLVNQRIIKRGFDGQVYHRNGVCEAAAVSVNVHASDLDRAEPRGEEVLYVDLVQFTVRNGEGRLHGSVYKNFAGSVSGRNIVFGRREGKLENHIVAGCNAHRVLTVIVGYPDDGSCRATSTSCSRKDNAFSDCLALIREKQLVFIAFLLQNEVVDLG